MKEDKKLPDPLTDTAQWYQEVIVRAELAEQAAVKGCMVIRPYGFAIWELIRDDLDRRIKGRGVMNAYFPLLIPQSFFSREAKHIEGFAPECAVVTHAGGKKLEEPLIVRPTSETIIHDSMARWIQSYRDLPMKLNQWANVIRWEKRPRLFLRNTEFLWQEGHTAHATEEEARMEVAEMLALYQDFSTEMLAIPTVTGRKSENERFAGAAESSSIEGLMPDGKGLQMGTAHYLGDNFSRMADVKFTNKKGCREFVQMTSWGVSTRLIGALIMAHGDKDGLVLPPSVSPVQVVVVPVATEKDPEGVSVMVNLVVGTLQQKGIRVVADNREDLKPGVKFNHWEARGVPLRVEVGPRNVQSGAITCAWRTRPEKESLEIGRIGEIPSLLDVFQNELLQKATASLVARTISVNTRKDLIECLTMQKGFIRAGWCGSSECEQGIKEQTKATIRNIPHMEEHGSEPCIWCNKKGMFIVYFAKAY